MAMQKSNLTDFEIVNLQQVLKHLSALDTRDKKVAAMIRKEVRKPFSKIRKKAKVNLRSIMAGSPVSKGNLERGLTVRTRVKRNTGYFSAAFGGRVMQSRKSKGTGANHFHLVNSGTAMRRTKRGLNRGAVGRRRTYDNRTNDIFRTGFASDAALSERSRVVSSVTDGIERIYYSIKTPGT